MLNPFYTGCQRQYLAPGVLPIQVCHTLCQESPGQTFAAAKPKKKTKKEAEAEEVKKRRRVLDETGRQQLYVKKTKVPVDDVYLVKYYPTPVYGALEAIDLLKRFQVLDFTPHDQAVYINLQLDMSLEKKKKVDQFVSTLQLPHPFKKDLNKVLVFTEDANQVKLALESGAAIAGGAELIKPLLHDEISADFYIAVPDILPKLLLLKSKLKGAFPRVRESFMMASNKSRTLSISVLGTVGVDIPKMVEVFKTGYEYQVDHQCYIITQIATLDMPTDHIFANLQAILTDACSHRPAEFGKFPKNGHHSVA
ncbi:39S ribosomal protein L1, mitochondrial-like [Thalassophryne amazonica]|uniref:39S ribosomal protein L1, mitochondrial-like n=1 Tax=Thalassophryne amazonica TaxID=390379 RepID=UPI001471A115|nr:39S ribosomal protein L1, mitochondrial-like [Thalassophryne amazonica]